LGREESRETDSGLQNEKKKSGKNAKTLILAVWGDIKARSERGKIKIRNNMLR